MHRFRSRFRDLRPGALFPLLICGAAFGFVQDNCPRYTAVAAGTLCAVFALYVVSGLTGPESTRPTSGGAATEQAALPVGPPTPAPAGTTEADDTPADSQNLELCDLCGRAEPRTWHNGCLDLPKGWLTLEIDRRAAELLYRTYCSEDHMRQDLARPLPTPEPPERETAWNPGPRTVGDRLAEFAWKAGLLLLVGFLLLGCVLAVRFLVELL